MAQDPIQPSRAVSPCPSDSTGRWPPASLSLAVGPADPGPVMGLGPSLSTELGLPLGLPCFLAVVVGLVLAASPCSTTPVTPHCSRPPREPPAHSAPGNQVLGFSCLLNTFLSTKGELPALRVVSLKKLVKRRIFKRRVVF